METLNIKQLPLTWRKFRTNLFYEYSGHQTVVCKQQIFLIGGRISVENVCDEEPSDLISEIKITGTKYYVLKELCHMPEPRRNHGAVVVDDKVLIFGGLGKDVKVLSSVLEFDPMTLTFKEMPPLPHTLYGMATVQWRDQVVLLGGYDGREKLNSVNIYDIKKVECFEMGSSSSWTYLPSTNEPRSRGIAEVLPFEQKYV
ncbi:gigaxonin-like [Xenia sp. Carnegie-2017]|uniref:gigaxonin-like n=1 Tax=Xenia sp. Carnegie-2017 TaxID=2897299 RepID=UPI001F0466ED|nr:gigaxonin-like [Xenia sp. Carnegie-2017]